MPIYEFACDTCHRIFQFFSRRVRPEAVPRCPSCGGSGLRRVPSTFAAKPKSRPEPGAGPNPDDALDSRMESAFAEMAGELEHLDEHDPRQMARLMRKLMDASGERPPEMEEYLRRLEAGEDPEKVEEEMEGLFGEEENEEAPPSGADEGEGPATSERSALRNTWRRMRRPSRDPRLYPLEEYLDPA